MSTHATFGSEYDLWPSVFIHRLFFSGFGHLSRFSSFFDHLSPFSLEFRQFSHSRKFASKRSSSQTSFDLLWSIRLLFCVPRSFSFPFNIKTQQNILQNTCDAHSFHSYVHVISLPLDSLMKWAQLNNVSQQMNQFIFEFH